MMVFRSGQSQLVTGPDSELEVAGKVAQAVARLHGGPQGVQSLVALGQGGVPYDVANLIGFLASPGAQGINGQTIRVCGGNIIGA